MSVISGYIFRPLLCTTKKNIQEYARANCTVFREDQSNYDITYDRNRIRLDIIPVLESLNPSIHESMGELAHYMQNASEFFIQRIEYWLESQKQLTSRDNTFLKSDFSLLSPFFQSEIISYLYARAELGSTQGLSR